MCDVGYRVEGEACSSRTIAACILSSDTPDSPGETAFTPDLPRETASTPDFESEREARRRALSAEMAPRRRLSSVSLFAFSSSSFAASPAAPCCTGVPRP